MRGFRYPTWRYIITFTDGSEIELLNSNNFPTQGGEELAKSLFLQLGKTADTITWTRVDSESTQFHVDWYWHHWRFGTYVGRTKGVPYRVIDIGPLSIQWFDA